MKKEGGNVDFKGHDYYTLIGEDEKSTFCEFYVIERCHHGIGREYARAQMEEMGKSYRGKNKKEYKIKNMEEKAGRCRLLSDFLEGLDIGHGGRFHIAINFLHIRGGKRLFLNTIEKYGFDLPKWKETFGYMRDNGYRPQGCCKCICWEICRNKGTLLSILQEDTDRRVLVTKERKYVSLEEGERRLLENIHRAVESLEPGIHLIRAQTALGKTEAACRVICENEDTRFIMALPTTKLKEEVYGQLKEMGVQAGCDKLKGKNLVIIGTPYTVDDRYKLVLHCGNNGEFSTCLLRQCCVVISQRCHRIASFFRLALTQKSGTEIHHYFRNAVLVAHYLGVDANRKEDFRPHRQRIEYNGYSFLYTTYKNELLREIQAYSISSELEQAIGRARLLREDCTVFLFSSFPCEQAQIHEKDYLAMENIDPK